MCLLQLLQYTITDDLFFTGVGVRDSNAGSGYNRGKLCFRVRTMYSSSLCLLPTEEETAGIHGANTEEIQKKLAA